VENGVDLMPDKEYFAAVWYAEFIGIGYLLNQKGWHVMPVFTNSKQAEEIWEKEIEPIDAKTLKMRFIEYENGEYRFMMYPSPYLPGKSNFSFYRGLAFSDSYRVFKNNFDGKTLFTFGILGDSPMTYRKSKLVTDVKFMKNSEVAENSPEWIAEEIQRRLRTGFG
jgi:hypothetical protein